MTCGGKPGEPGIVSKIMSMDGWQVHGECGGCENCQQEMEIDMSIFRDILVVVQEIGDPLMEHIVAKVAYPEPTVEFNVLFLVREGYLRQKEDLIDHDWSYRLTKKGKDYLAGRKP